MGGTLHLRGSVPVPKPNSDGIHGILYNPSLFYNRHQVITTKEERQQLLKTIAPFQWYRGILRTTLDSEPILHCHGLHEWAMQYHPEGAPPPPSARYQSNLPLRVSREVINQTVERKGISCTHVDALRFFAPAAGPLNHHGSELERMDQLHLEQKACVHAHMDLLKIALKLQPYIDSELIGDVLEISLASRRLDVEASPYDATSYGAGIVPVENAGGRKMYREQQKELMARAEPIRERLLGAYELFMDLSFEEEFLEVGITGIGNKARSTSSQAADDGSAKDESASYIAPERFAKAQPGGLPWRRNLIKSP